MTGSWAGALVEAHALGVTLGRRRVLDAVELTVEPGRWLAVVGPDGAGKSTLLRALAGVAKHRGRVLLDGADVSTLSGKDRARLTGYATAAHALPEGTKVREYVMVGRAAHRALLAGPRDDDRAVVDDALERLDLTGLADRPLRTLGGGERQRVVLARAFAQQPRLLLLDEPTGTLDVGQAQRVLELVDALREREGVTVVSTLHDLSLAGQYADDVLMLAGGRAVASGAPKAVLTAEAIAEHFGATVEVTGGRAGVRVHPVRPVPPR